jgi:general secretion pathway protein G
MVTHMTARIPMNDAMNGGTSRGFTLIELVVVMAVIGLLLTLALPRYIHTLDRGKEQVLKQNLYQMREALDKFYGDNGKYPDRLDDLVTRRYLRAIPLDPFSELPNWIVIAPREPEMGGVLDVQSAMTDPDGRPRLGASDEAGNTAVGQTPERVGSPALLSAAGVRR